MDTPYVREYVEDREVTAWLLLDHSASMGFGPVDRQKDLVLAEVATTLALVLTRRGNRVGMVVFDQDVERILPARSGRNQVLQIADVLLDRRNARAAAAEAAPAPRARRRRSRRENGPERHVTDLGAMLNRSAGMIRRRSLVVVVSDFISEPGWEQALEPAGPAPRGGRPAGQRPARGRAARRRRRSTSRTPRPASRSSSTPPTPGFRSRLRAAADERQAAPRGGHPFGRRRPAPDPHRRGPRPRPCCASPPCAGGGADEPRLAVGAVRPARPPPGRRRIPAAAAAAGRAPGRPRATGPRRPDAPGRPVAARRAGPARRGARRDAARAVPPGRRRRGAAARGHGHPRLRRLHQHGGEGHAADPARRGQGGRQGVRREAAVDREGRRRRVRRQRGHRPAADHRQGPGPRVRQPPDAAGRDVARPGDPHVAERHRRQAHRQQR